MTATIDSIQESFFYYVGVVSVAVGAIKLGILAVRKLWIESVEVVEETDELVHLIVADVKQIHNGQDRGHVFMWGAPSTEAANVLIR